MEPLYQILKAKVNQWRLLKHQCDFPVIEEILRFNYEPVKNTLRFLRKAQYEALESYWYLRTVEMTPHIFDLYKRLLKPRELLASLAINLSQEDLMDLLLAGSGVDSIFERIKHDDNFVRKYSLEALRETLALTYPSYILALAMGAGKTILIGSIIATEFAMALEYPNSEFVRNALVFAPGKTILGALKELSDVPYKQILPPRLYKQFIATTKFTYTRDGEKDIPIIKGSWFNIIVTNTEKIRIQKKTISKSLYRDLFVDTSREEEVKEAIANQRLQTVASLPSLAIFSDEAHHTYGIALGKDLKRVRQTVNYLATNTSVLVVLNTTGTPYYKKQILKDVVYWYGLSQGISDGILKEVRGNIISYPEVVDSDFLQDVVSDFLRNYGDVEIYDGSSAKLAIYFPKIDDLQKAKTFVEKTLIKMGVDTSIVLEVHNKSKDEVKDLFDNRINDPHLKYRIFLLVNKGTEGWNCLSLFATALARELKTGNNFCLQAASRCLRQTVGNRKKAKIYLSKKNVRILDAQLKETYGESLEDLNRTLQDTRKETLIVRKLPIPPVLIKDKIMRVVPLETDVDVANIDLKPVEVGSTKAKKIIHSLADTPREGTVLLAIGEEELNVPEEVVDTYTLAVELAHLYHLSPMSINAKLQALFPEGELSVAESMEIRRQIEKQVHNYRIQEEEIEKALALIKSEGFKRVEQNDESHYVTEIIYHVSKEKYLLRLEDMKDRRRFDFGFHYDPYKFDSSPEKHFYKWLLEILNEEPADIQDIYYTGGISDPKKTDFLFEYKGKDGEFHNYSPDFMIRRKDGRVYVVEVKAERFKDEAKEKKMRRIEGLNPDSLKYEIVETEGDQVTFDGLNKVKDVIYRYQAS